MTYQELFDEIKLLSKRGDLDDKITAALRMVTLRAHRVDYFHRDLVEAQLYFGGTQQTLVGVNVIQWLPRFRAVNYARYWKPTDTLLGNLLTPIDPRAVLDQYNAEIYDRYYLAGDVLKLRFEYPAYGVQIGYYADPILVPAQYNSWIAEKLPDLLIQGALAQIFNWTGKQEEARLINALVGFETNPGNNAAKGPTLVEQLRQFALEDVAR